LEKFLILVIFLYYLYTFDIGGEVNMPLPMSLTQYQQYLLNDLSINSTSDLINKQIMDLYNSNILPILYSDLNPNDMYSGMRPTGTKTELDLFYFNVLRMAHHYVNTHDKEISLDPESNYDNANIKLRQRNLKQEIMRYNAIAGEALASISIFSWQDLDDFIKSKDRESGKNTPQNNQIYRGWIHHPREVSQDLFQEVLKKIDVSPQKWYNLFFSLELICYKHMFENPGPPPGRFP
jgi:hypothetical protein